MTFQRLWVVNVDACVLTGGNLPKFSSLPLRSQNSPELEIGFKPLLSSSIFRICSLVVAGIHLWVSRTGRARRTLGGVLDASWSGPCFTAARVVPSASTDTRGLDGPSSTETGGVPFWRGGTSTRYACHFVGRGLDWSLLPLRFLGDFRTGFTTIPSSLLTCGLGSGCGCTVDPLFLCTSRTTSISWMGSC